MKRNTKYENKPKTQSYYEYPCLKAGLKAESNNDRRTLDRQAIRRYMSGDDGIVFARSLMGDRWHWD